jgi:hypothetical protein
MHRVPLAALALLLSPAAFAQDSGGAFGEDDAAAATYEELAAAPPALPSSLAPADLYATLTEAQRATVDKDQRVVTFAERIGKGDGATRLEGVSIGMMREEPATIVALLAALDGYPDWLRMQPSYKSVRLEGRSRLVCGIGSTDSTKAKRQMTYDVTPRADGVTWTVVDSGTPLQRGSFLELIVAPHPTIPGASLVVHHQVGLVPAGRMLNYLASDDKEGRNRWWKDCNRHARRLHWAIDAAVANPPGEQRRSAYVASYQREFRGKSPVWAE